MTQRIKDGTVKQGKTIDWTGDIFNRANTGEPEGYYVMFGMWKGPFPSAHLAKEAYKEWAWEMKHG